MRKGSVMPTRTWTKELEILGGKRKLHIVYDPSTLSEMDLAQVKVRLPRVFRRAVLITNNCHAKALAFKSAEAMMRVKKHRMLYTLLKDYLKLQMRKRHSGAWTTHSDFIFSSFINEWRLDRNKPTKDYMARVFGTNATTLHGQMCGKTPNELAQTVRNTMLSTISGLNLENVYICAKNMGAVGSALYSHGGWRYAGQGFSRTRMEEHLNAWEEDNPINLNKNYFKNVTEIGDGESGSWSDYRGLYGVNLTFEDHLTKTLIHEASHLFAGSADYYYFRPHNRKLRADKAGDLPDPSPAHPVATTENCALNADSIAWFLYYWGDGQQTGDLDAYIRSRK